METWIAADVVALRAHDGSQLQESALPPRIDLEQRSRDESGWSRARHRNRPNAYIKGQRSFVILAGLDPTVLADLLPSFARVKAILNANLPTRPSPPKRAGSPHRQSHDQAFPAAC